MLWKKIRIVAGEDIGSSWMILRKKSKFTIQLWQMVGIQAKTRILGFSISWGGLFSLWAAMLECCIAESNEIFFFWKKIANSSNTYSFEQIEKILFGNIHHGRTDNLSITKQHDYKIQTSNLSWRFKLQGLIAIWE